MARDTEFKTFVVMIDKWGFGFTAVPIYAANGIHAKAKAIREWPNSKIGKVIAREKYKGRID